MKRCKKRLLMSAGKRLDLQKGAFLFQPLILATKQLTVFPFQSNEY
jgi:hypothetical protein